MTPGGTSRPFAGPCLVPTLSEVALIRAILHGRTDPAAQVLAAKCDRALSSDPRLRKPPA
jgi:hypothetical protein